MSLARKELPVYIHSKSTNRNTNFESDQEEPDDQGEVYFDAKEEETPLTNNV